MGGVSWRIYLLLARWAGSHGGFIYCWLGGWGVIEHLFAVSWCHSRLVSGLLTRCAAVPPSGGLGVCVHLCPPVGVWGIL